MTRPKISAARIDDLREPLTQLIIEALGEDELEALAFRSERYILETAIDVLCRAEVTLALDAAIDAKEIVAEARRAYRNSEAEAADRCETIRKLEAFNGK